MTWHVMSCAPTDGTPILIETIGGAFLKAHWDGSFTDGESEPTGAWVAENEHHPKCWTDGVCWASNEDEEPSDPPKFWQQLSPIKKVEYTAIPHVQMINATIASMLASIKAHRIGANKAMKIELQMLWNEFEAETIERASKLLQHCSKYA